jgi:AcrR family transcriptional regulator
MPKVIDHEARRAELAAAVWRVVGRSGIQGATVRAVAAEAGVSPGALRHYFADQMGLLRFAAEMMSQRAAGRLQEHLSSGRTGRDLSHSLLEELLPLDANRRIEAVVWLEGLAQARRDPSLAELKAAGWIGERYVCRVAFASAKGLPIPERMSNELEDPADERAVGLLHTFIDGLTLQASMFPDRLDPQDVSIGLDRFLSALLGDPAET